MITGTFINFVRDIENEMLNAEMVTHDHCSVHAQRSVHPLNLITQHTSGTDYN